MLNTGGSFHQVRVFVSEQNRPALFPSPPVSSVFHLAYSIRNCTEIGSYYPKKPSFKYPNPYLAIDF